MSRWLVILGVLWGLGCVEDTFVVVENRTSFQLSEVTFGDCIWDEPLDVGGQTTGCLPSKLEDRVRFRVVVPPQPPGMPLPGMMLPPGSEYDAAQIYRVTMEVVVERGEVRVLAVEEGMFEEDPDQLMMPPGP